MTSSPESPMMFGGDLDSPNHIDIYSNEDLAKGDLCAPGERQSDWCSHRGSLKDKAASVIMHPFRFYFRDYDLQGQESESFVLRFVDQQFAGPVDDAVANALVTLLADCPSAWLSGDHGPVDGIAHLEVFYERNDEGELDYAAFDDAVDDILRTIHATHPLAEVVHAGGSSAGDAWEKWSRSQAEPTPTAVELVMNEAGYTQRIYAPDLPDLEAYGGLRRLERGTLCARVNAALDAAEKAANAAELAAGQAARRPEGLGLYPVDAAAAEGAKWLSKPSPAVAKALADESGEPSFWFDRWGVTFPDGGAAGLLLLIERKFSKRELAWVTAAGEVTRSGVTLPSMFSLPDGSVVFPYGGNLRRLAPGMEVAETLGAWKQPAVAVAGLGDDLLIRTLDRKGKDAVALARAGEGTLTTLATVPLAAKRLRSVPGRDLVLAWTDTKLWCLTVHDDELRASKPIACEVQDIGLLDDRVVILREDDAVFELCHVDNAP